MNDHRWEGRGEIGLGRSVGVGGGCGWRGGITMTTTYRRWLDFWRERLGEDDVMFVNMHGTSTEKIHIVPYVGLSFSE